MGNQERLLHLIDILVRVVGDKKPFNMEVWIASPGMEHDCETASCALGWAARDPKCINEGLHLSRLGRPTCDGFLGYHAAAHYYELSTRTAQFIFDPEYYDDHPDANDVTPGIVIEHVLAVMNDTHWAQMLRVSMQE